MNDFTFFFIYGWDHIISPYAIDHLLFILALTAIYSPDDWKQVIFLITAFTFGHATTLALSVYDITRFNSKWVEFLIPVTIMVTSVLNFFVNKEGGMRFLKTNYLPALFFGLIHGMGFANAIRFMLPKNVQIGWPLLGFNVGLEAGQVSVVCLILMLFYLIVVKAGFSRKGWIWSLSGIAFLISLYLGVIRWPL